MESENLQLLINLKQIVEVSQSRGCWKAEEMRDIGITYNSLSVIIKNMENKNQDPEPEPEPDPKISEIISEVENNESDNVMEEIN